jgi:anti-sigma factor RsiW
MNQAELLEMMADFLNGALSAKQATAFEAHLDANPAARQQLENMRVLREELVRQAEAETDAAWTVMQTRLQAESVSTGLAALWRRWRLRAGLLVAIGVAAFEAFLLLNAPAYRAAPDERETQAIQVLFAPDAPQRQVRELLDQVHAQVSAGPGASGEYTVQVHKEEAGAALAALRATPIVQDAYPRKSLP